MISILTARDNVVDCYLDEGQVFAGGNALNVAVFARRAGARTAYAGTVGSDDAGALILRQPGSGGRVDGLCAGPAR